MHEKSFINFDNVTFNYNINQDNDENLELQQNTSSNAITSVNLSIERGSFVAIVGRNGSGKSTVARLINALILPTEGTVVVDGINTVNEKLIWDIRRNVGMVFQNPDNQIIGTSVEEDIAFGPENLGVERTEILKRIDEVIDVVGLVGYRNHSPHLLSGGQKQRVAIAGILAMKPECIILDEATAMLDPIGRREVMNVIKKLNKENNITIIHITHHMDEAAEADRIVLIYKGNLIADGTPRKIFSDVDKMKQVGLETPQVTLLFSELIKRGVKLPGDITSIDEAVMLLKPLLEVDA